MYREQISEIVQSFTGAGWDNDNSFTGYLVIGYSGNNLSIVAHKSTLSFRSYARNFRQEKHDSADACVLRRATRLPRRLYSPSYLERLSKSLGRTYSVALWVDKEGLFGPFHPPSTSQTHEQSVARTLFGQSQMRCYRKLASGIWDFWSETQRPEELQRELEAIYCPRHLSTTKLYLYGTKLRLLLLLRRRLGW